MLLKILLLITCLLSSLSLADDDTCTLKRGKCGLSPGPCNENGCAGMNDSKGGLGVCTAGPNMGCSCVSACGPTNGNCWQYSCAGREGADGKMYCTGGGMAGCRCESKCNANALGPCSDPACQGRNKLVGLGTCTSGTDITGCPCKSVCGSPVYCDSPGCAGTNSLVVGALGVCTTGTYAGCTCKSICGKRPGPCVNCGGKRNALGQWRCRSGKYTGCLCVGLN